MELRTDLGTYNTWQKKTQSAKIRINSYISWSVFSAPVVRAFCCTNIILDVLFLTWTQNHGMAFITVMLHTEDVSFLKSIVS